MAYESANKISTEFEDECFHLINDVMNSEGFFHIQMRGHQWAKDFDSKVETLIEGLKIAFPYVTDFIEDGELFWENVMNNLDK